MGIIKFIFYLGVIQLIFDFVWKKVVVFPSSLLFTMIRFDKGVLIIKSIGAYSLVSLTTFFVFSATQESGILWTIIHFLFGGISLFVLFSISSFNAQKHALETDDYATIKTLEYDIFITLGGIILYVISAFLPAISLNGLTMRFLELIYWVIDIKMPNWLIVIGGVSFLLFVIWYGFILTSILIVALGNLLKRNNENEDTVFKKLD